MNKKILVVACLAIMTIAFSGCSLLGEDKDKEMVKEGDKNQEGINNTEQNQKNDKESSEENNKSGDGNYYETLKDLMDRGKSMKCTYTQEVEGGGTATGVVYMADKNARIEITTNEGTGHAGKMYAIIDQKWTYNWVEGSSQGFKMTLEASEPGEKNEETISNMTKEIEFECKSWKKDNSKFKVQTNIEFQDMSEMMEGFEDVDLEKEIKDAEAQGNKMICEICKNAPDPEDCLDGAVCDWSK